jgi:hypothetical protein
MILDGLVGKPPRFFLNLGGFGEEKCQKEDFDRRKEVENG